MEVNGVAKNGKHALTSKNPYPEFTLGESLTKDQIEFFEKNGFIHFKNFISKEMVEILLRDAEKIQDEWVSQGYKMINGVPIKYGTDITGKTIVQRFAFLNQHSTVFADLLKDTRLKALFSLIGTEDCRIGETEKDGLVFNHYINTEESNYTQLGWHTDALRDVFQGQKILPMLNVGIHMDTSTTDNGGLRLIPGTHNQGLRTLLFKKFYFISHKPDKSEIGLNVEPGDLTVHDGRLWHRVARSPFIGEKSRRRVMYIPIITGKFKPRTENSKPLFYQRFAGLLTNK
ncbi:MAG: phytanoyl-CoA dioxygenase family protein [Cytophagales bacterium]|jgi:ectoine hydroxylase-related dioxygenase (phytanoyl-CoA dioxygenase family)|nr:phytanoyl-CoA dioxygenase family protein [Cytophagales bacterium]MCA6367422.1 phytanoyl-CoA dioxygenase family protein [Cytophagales bacterium]MCA6373724.1 phytanoyl-CoA dioxygenase family protein [Cytophagales bacterium]MCA6377246.1 phytanoyl-CoA dioxygenase family protein [Cytophagales bacterium]MCA6383913.1 phytanoyl-CoA dioxygenase family protein [Cytophagales bacterium]